MYGDVEPVDGTGFEALQRASVGTFTSHVESDRVSAINDALCDEICRRCSFASLQSTSEDQTDFSVRQVNAIEIDPWNTNRLWVAADRGVFQTLDAGGTWADFSATLPNCYIGDLIFHQHARVLRAGTRNRGVWEIPVDGWMTTPICGVQWTGSLAANQTQRWFTFNWPATWHMIWTVMPTSFAPGAPQITWKVQVERASAEFVTYWITVTNLTAAPVTFEGRYCILSRY